MNDEASIDDISLDTTDEHITNVLPSLSEIFMNSCLIPTLASYLRNDSGMKEIPLRFFIFVTSEKNVKITNFYLFPNSSRHGSTCPAISCCSWLCEMYCSHP